MVCGKNARGHYHIVTLVERQTRFAFTEKIKGKHPDNLNRILLKMIAKYNIPVFSITTDNGFEFRKLGLIGYKLG
ncbi:putative transposase, partial [Chlamydia psittaci 02DC23]